MNGGRGGGGVRRVGGEGAKAVFFRAGAALAESRLADDLTYYFYL